MCCKKLHAGTQLLGPEWGAGETVKMPKGMKGVAGFLEPFTAADDVHDSEGYSREAAAVWE